MSQSTNVLDSVYFIPQFDLTKDIVITLDYYTSVPVYLPNGVITPFVTACAASGGIAFGLFDATTYNSPVGTDSYEYLGGFFTNALISVLFDFDGNFNGISNTCSIYSGPAFGEFELDSGVTPLTATFLGSNVPKRVRARFTDFGNTYYIDSYNFQTNTFYPIQSGSWGSSQCPISAVGAYVTYAYDNYQGIQPIYITNININGQPTLNYTLQSGAILT